VKQKVIPTSANYNYYLKADLSRFREGEWIAIAKNRVMAHGDDAGKVYRAAQRKAKTDDISLAKVPSKQLLILKVSM
jgi:hypothetical protein